MKEYVGRYRGAEFVVFIKEDGKIRPLPPRFDVFEHSPCGFAWGYTGSGPSQLALAILCDHLRDIEKAKRIYQDFKMAVIARLPIDQGFRLTPEDIDLALAKLAS